MEKQKTVEKTGKKKLLTKRIIIVLAVVAVTVALAVPFMSSGSENFRSKYEGSNLESDIVGYSRADTYDAYLQSHNRTSFAVLSAPAVDTSLYMDVRRVEAAPPAEGEAPDRKSVV